MPSMATIESACELVTDGTHYTPKDVGVGIPFLTVRDVSESGLDFVGCSYITEFDYRAAASGNSAPMKGDVLFSKDGTVGKVHVVASDKPFAVLSSLAILRPKKGTVDAMYLGHVLRSPDTLNEALKKKTGSAIRRIILSDLKGVRIYLPPITEQRRIAAILDLADALRAKRREALAQLDSLTQSIFIEMFGDSVSNPKKWPLAGIDEVCELIVDCVNRTAPVVDGPTPYKMIRTTNVKYGKVNLSEVRYVTEATFLTWNRRTTPIRGDVVLTREAPLGEAGVLESDENVFLGQRLMLYRADIQRLAPKYLLASFQSQFLQSQFSKHGSGSTVKHLSLPACRNFQILLPPIQMQNEFVKRITVIEKLNVYNSGALSTLDGLFASLQHHAFQGEL